MELILMGSFEFSSPLKIPIGVSAFIFIQVTYANYIIQSKFDSDYHIHALFGACWNWNVYTH